MRHIAIPVILAALLPTTLLAAEPRPVDFNRDIRPILTATCYHCHGPDQKQRKADLRLDIKEGMFADLEGAFVIVPREPEESELFLRITSDDESEQMPPPGFKKSLTKPQIELIRAWIAQGAEWKGHWAYIKPQRPPVPEAGSLDFARNEIDSFILKKLKERGFRHSPPADRVTLIRRLSFDLTGLPPTTQQVDEFVNDKSPDAYEKLVARLLGSPHFGERMAMYWLDMVRYADTNGIHGDNHRDVSLFRDYVIGAFNENKPFDQFAVEQLAGDLLPESTLDNKVASGYNRMLMTTREGGAQAKEYLAKYAADRVRNVSVVWLGATMGCAECHNHKFDPHTMKDFYSLAAFFADIKETAVGVQQPTPIPTAKQQNAIDRLNAQITPLQKTLNTQTPQLDAARTNWEESVKSRKIEWAALQPVTSESKGGATLKTLDDGSVLVTGENPQTDVFTVTLKPRLKAITAVKLEVLPDDSLPQRGPGRAGNGNFVLNEFQATLGGKPIEWAGVTASHSQKDWNVAGAIDGKPATGWAILPKIKSPHQAVFETKSDVGDGSETTLTIQLQQNHKGSHTIGRFRISVTNSARPIRADGKNGLPDNIADILAIEETKRTDKRKQDIAAYYRTIAPSLAPVRKELADLQAKQKALQAALPKTLVSLGVQPRIMRILPRGNWLDDSGAVVTPAVPAAYGGWNLDGDRRATRLDLAKWLISPDNPVTARVFVNRLWKLMFGQGIVKSLDDFGTQGAWPTHPELLDWLATEFVESGWDVKHMIELIVMSGTYRQSSAAGEDLRGRDPFNEWLARQGRFRLDAEMVRDNALAIGGLLVDKVGGRSVKPYQPAGYWSHLNFPKRVYKHDTGENQYRRGVYTYWCRTFLHPSMLAFDAPTREECTVERPRSNTPLQALVLLNDPTYVEAARAFAERIMNAKDHSTQQRIALAFRLALSRKPRPEEVTVLTGLYEKHLAQYRADHSSAEKIQTVGLRPTAKETDNPQLAAWISVARVILNLHETITRY